MHVNGLVVSRATLSDAEELSSVQLKCWMETSVEKLREVSLDDFDEMYGTYDQVVKRWQERLRDYKSNDKERLILLARIDGRIIGYAHVFQDKISRSIIIKRFFILNEFQGKGIGYTMMEKIFKWSKDRRPIILRAAEANHDAQRFYEKFGFQLTSEIVSSERMISVRMILEEK